MTTEFRLEDVERLGAILDQVEMDGDDRLLLHAIFARAGSTASQDPEPEVSGFGLVPTIPNATLFDAFNLGLSTSGSGGGGKSPTISVGKTTDSSSPLLFQGD